MARTMKDSGIEWIGTIPFTWGTIRFKYLHNGMNTGEGLDKEFWSTDENDIVFYTAGLEPIRTSYKEFPKWKYTQDNDLLLARNGTPYVYYPLSGACYTDHIIRASLKSGINRRFVQYSLQQSISKVVVDSVSIATWSASLWNEQYIAWPSQAEQERIVNFLDTKCARIDEVIEQTRASIEEYKKLKQSIITEAVTKGIRSERPMKNSEVEWIGEIPEDWTVALLKYSIRWKSVKGQPDSQVLSLYRDYGVIPKDSRDDNHNVTSLDTSGYKVVEVGDFVINKMKAWQGSMAVSSYNGIVSPAYHVCEIINPTINRKYLHHLLRNQLYLPEYLRLSTGMRIGQWDLGFDDFKNLPFILPGYEEQDEIVTFIEKKSSEIDHLIEVKEQLLSELDSYKKSLIYECITGKKEVD